MDKAKRSSEQIDKEIQDLRAKIRDLEGQRQDRQKTVERARKQRTERAFAAHADKDKRAGEQLTKAREIQVKAALELEDLESAIAEGRSRFEALEHEWRAALREEEWQAILALAEEAQKEAEQIDAHMNGLAELLGSHQIKLEQLKARSQNLGVQRAFGTTGVRHAFRRLNWLLIKSGASGEVEKPSEVYRQTTYSAILALQVEAAKKIFETQPNGQDGETQPEEPEADVGAEAGAEASTQ
jgi:hypothetical protein